MDGRCAQGVRAAVIPPRRGANFRAGGYVPAMGDVVHLDWSPQMGSEMRGPHYGLVVSATLFNTATGHCVVVPITSKSGKLGGFEFPVAVGRVDGVAILSGLRSLDYQVRDLQFEASGGEALASRANKLIALFLPP